MTFDSRRACAAVTFLDRQGGYDPGASGALYARLAEAGIDGLLVFGTTGEGPSFTVAERVQAIGAATRVAGSLPVVVGCGACALPDVLDLVRGAGDAGAAAVLVPPPFYFVEPPGAGLARFFEAVLETARIPVLLYHIPALTHAPITPALVAALAGHPRLLGAKDSTGQRESIAALAAAPGFRVWAGSDRLVREARTLGAFGTMSAAGNAFAAEVVAAADGDGPAQGRLDAVLSCLDRARPSSRVAAWKWLASLRTVPGADPAVRPPLAALDGTERVRLGAALTEAGLGAG